MKAAEMDAAAAAWGNVLLALSLLGTAWAWLTARKRAFTWALLLWFPVRFLCLFGVVRLGAYLSARLVAALLVQHALRDGAAAGPCAGAGLCGAVCAGRRE